MALWAGVKTILRREPVLFFWGGGWGGGATTHTTPSHITPHPPTIPHHTPPHRTAPHCTAPCTAHTPHLTHHTTPTPAPHRTALHRTAPHRELVAAPRAHRVRTVATISGQTPVNHPKMHPAKQLTEPRTHRGKSTLRTTPHHTTPHLLHPVKNLGVPVFVSRLAAGQMTLLSFPLGLIPCHGAQ